MKKKKFDIAMFRRYLLLSAILLSGIIIIEKSYAFGAGFHPPEHFEVHLPYHDADNMEQDARRKKREQEYDRLDKIEQNRPLTKNEQSRKDDMDADTLRSCSNRKNHAKHK